MGLHQRWYMGGHDSDAGGKKLSVGVPRPTPIVKLLLILNVAVFILQLLFDRDKAMSTWLGVTVGGWWQLWRYVTFQFLHSPQNAGHIIFNMLGVWMLGSPLEKQWGGAKFLKFYLACGAAAGAAYVIIGATFPYPHNLPIIGASGGVFAVMLVCAVLFPQLKLLILPIRWAAIIIFWLMILDVLTGMSRGDVNSAMSDVAHLGGAGAAAIWIWGAPMLRRTLGQAGERARRGVWQRQLNRKQQQDAQVDAILAKIKDQGINSLTDGERKTLQDATRRQREEDQRLRRL